MKKREKVLFTNIANPNIESSVVYFNEKRWIEIEPYGFWNEEYLQKLYQDFKAMKSEQIESAKNNYLFLAYISNWESEKSLGSYAESDILDVASYGKILKIERKEIKKGIFKYRILFSGISNYSISYEFNDEDKAPKKVKLEKTKRTLDEINELHAHKIKYTSEYKETKKNSKIINEITETVRKIDQCITGLVEQGIWDKIISAKLNVGIRNITFEEWMKFSHDLISITKTDGSNSSIISSLMLYLAFDNNEKYQIVSKFDFIDQFRLLYHYAQAFYWLPALTEADQKVLKKFEIFNDEKFEKTPWELPDNLKRKEAAEKAKIKPSKNDIMTDALIEEEINKKVKNNLEKQQKEFLLREKMRAIKESLSENDPESSDDDEEYQKIINDPKTKNIFPESVIKLINSEKDRLKTMMSGTPDANTAAAYLNVLKKMPWRKIEIETLDIKKARKVLDKNHYGLKDVKERIVEYLSLIINHKNIAKLEGKDELIDLDSNHQIDMSLFKEDPQSQKVQNTFNNVPILTLVGPPGTGKTSLARSIAEALNKSYIKISLGGVHDESEIRGHRRTYVGSMPGKIIKAIQRAGVSNPLILLDEIDKMSSDYKGDPSSAMLEVLDPEQNTKFQDNYLEHEYDLSKVMFIATANYYENIPAPLLDRVEIIELNSYTIDEKIKIAKEHLIDITVKQAGLKPEQFIIDEKTIEFIIKRYTIEAGVRALKRNFDKMARKIVTQIVSGKKIDKFVIDQKKAIELLGTPKYSDDDEATKKSEVGVVTGLAYTSVGGSTLQIEVATFPGKNGIKLTGSLKDVMKESANIALTYVRANAEHFGIKNFDFDENEIHIHVPEGAVPKDGPSAGVTFTTALISALSGKPVKQNIAMTGEITLRGRVLEIGGLKEKSFAAFKHGIKTVFIPKNNEKNLTDIPEEVIKAVKFIPVEKYDQIYDYIFKGE